MDPGRFDGVEPRTFDGQVAGDDANATAAPLDLAVVVADPVAHRLADVPGGVVPDQEQGREALRRELCGAPRQVVDGDGADGSADRRSGATSGRPAAGSARSSRP